MASIKLKMQSLGMEPPCENCEQPFTRGAQMNGVESDAGEPLGWFCDDCIATWNEGLSKDTLNL